MHIKEEQLKTILLDSELISDRAFESAKQESIRSGQSITDILIGKEKITEDYLVELLAGYLNKPIVNLKKEAIPPEVLFLLPENYAKSKNLVLFDFDKENKIAKLAMLDPLDLEVIEFIRAKFDCWAVAHITTPASLKFGLKQYKKGMGMEFNQIIDENIKQSYSLAGDSNVSKMAEAVPIITILDSILENAVVLGASDIHFEPLEDKLLVRYRIDGIMQEILNMPKVIAPILAALLIDEHRVPQDGRFHFDLEEKGKIDIRVNVMPVLNGEKVEMRLLKSSNKPLSLKELGLSDEGASVIEEEIKKPHGMILVTGPTGHGKTTTLYSILHILNTPKVNITTIEDPIEYEVARINQTQVNVKAGITFANGLRSLLRQNPDIIMIGEIRDNETVDIAIHASLTGHLVLSSLHTNDAPSSIPRLLDMNAQNFLLASTLNLVIAQRLVRKICLSCIESTSLTARNKAMIKELESAAGKKGKVKVPKSLFRGKGCKVCGDSGFVGQIGIFEILKISEPVKKLIDTSAPLTEIRKAAIADGMVTMFEDGLEKAEEGMTTIEEVLRVVRE